MTTPERLKRRQLVEGACLILIGVLMVVQSWHFHSVDNRQRAEARAQRQCLVEKFADLSEALGKRAALSDRETEENRELWGIYAEAAGLVRDAQNPELPPAEQRRLNEKLVAQLLEYKRVMDGVSRDKRDNPLPPFPSGVCD